MSAHSAGCTIRCKLQIGFPRIPSESDVAFGHCKCILMGCMDTNENVHMRIIFSVGWAVALFVVSYFNNPNIVPRHAATNQRIRGQRAGGSKSGGRGVAPFSVLFK